jgi:hypothetical protein
MHRIRYFAVHINYDTNSRAEYTYFGKFCDSTGQYYNVDQQLHGACFDRLSEHHDYVRFRQNSDQCHRSLCHNVVRSFYYSR